MHDRWADIKVLNFLSNCTKKSIQVSSIHSPLLSQFTEIIKIYTFIQKCILFFSNFLLLLFLIFTLLQKERYQTFEERSWHKPKMENILWLWKTLIYISFIAVRQVKSYEVHIYCELKNLTCNSKHFSWNKDKTYLNWRQHPLNSW